MHPDRELIRLAAYKAALQGRIRKRRAECIASTSRLARPIVWIDRVVVLWRQMSPLVKLATVPVALLAQRRFSRLQNGLTPFIRWVPLLFSAVSAVNAARKSRR